jgi:PASTA domain
MRKTAVMLMALALAGCGGTPQPKRVPDVRGQRLDVAEARLEARGLRWEEVGGGVFGVVVRSHWYVEDQIPLPGKRATTVKLVVERCDDDD